jgi:hypothetical protein
MQRKQKKENIKSISQFIWQNVVNNVFYILFFCAQSILNDKLSSKRSVRFSFLYSHTEYLQFASRYIPESLYIGRTAVRFRLYYTAAGFALWFGVLRESSIVMRPFAVFIPDRQKRRGWIDRKGQGRTRGPPLTGMILYFRFSTTEVATLKAVPWRMPLGN